MSFDGDSDAVYAWAAGILEGEGCFSIHRRKDRSNTLNTAIHCEMTDEDIIRRLHAVFKVGTVNARKNMSGRKDTRARKATWIWSAQKKADVLEVILRVLPYLGERRAAKAKELMVSIEERGYEN
jgi:hypothetical protein